MFAFRTAIFVGDRVTLRQPRGRHRTGDQLCDDGRVEGGAASGDTLERRHELIGVENAFLQQVSDAAGPVGEELGISRIR